MAITLKSPAFENGSRLPVRHTGEGEDLSHALSWEGVPPDAKELALIMDDSDAPTPQPWVHWVIYHIPVTCTSLPEGTNQKNGPEGSKEGLNTWGTLGYRGPLPPKGHGEHRYVFRLYALNTELILPTKVSREALDKAMSGHIIAEGALLGTFERKYK